MVGAQGRLIAHPDISLVLRQYRYVQIAASAGAQTGNAVTGAEALQGAQNIQGQEVLTASAPIAPLGWTMFVELPVEEAYASLYAALPAPRHRGLRARRSSRCWPGYFGAAHGRSDPGLARRRRAHRQRRFSPSAFRFGPGMNSKGLPISSTTWARGCRNPMLTWRTRSNSGLRS